ncbi:hemerythrin domain-containing protein [Brevundimonas sp.]
MNTEKLCQDHAVILRSAGHLTGLAAQVRSRGDAVDVRSVMDRMDAGLVIHLAHEDTEIYPRLMNHPELALQALAQEAFAELGVIKGAWTSYRDTWTVDRILAGTARFASCTTAMVQALAMRIEMENDVLYPAVRKAMVEPS